MRYRTYWKGQGNGPKPFVKEASGFKSRVDKDPAASVGTVLVVDDKRHFREENSALVRRFGFSVMTASHGEEALGIYRQRKHPISLVLLDYNMPGMDGHEVLLRLKRLDPEARVAICSQGLSKERIGAVLEAGALRFIPKPVLPHDLEHFLRDMNGAVKA